MTAPFRLPAAARLHDPYFYLGDPHPYYDQMRRHAPLYWHQPDDPEYLPFWVASSHEAVRAITRNMDAFTSTQGILINDNTRSARAGINVSSIQIPAGSEPPALSDPPRHTMLRGLLMKSFSPKLIKSIEDDTRQVVSRVLDAVPVDEDFDFIEKVAVPIPIYVIAGMLGVPERDMADFKRWADDVVSTGGPLSPEAIERMKVSAAEIQAYMTEHIERCRANPGNDLISAFLAVEHNGERFNAANVLMMARTILTAGNETTRNSLSRILWALLRHPDQLRTLQQRPELMPTAIEELLRYTAVLIGMCRRAKQDVEVAGTVIRAGDFVQLNYQSANRDETVYADPHTLDVTRKVDPMHLTFSHGPHICPGQLLARMEIRIAVEEMLKRFSRFEARGEPTLMPSNLIIATAAMPVRFGR